MARKVAKVLEALQNLYRVHMVQKRRIRRGRPRLSGLTCRKSMRPKHATRPTYHDAEKKYVEKYPKVDVLPMGYEHQPVELVRRKNWTGPRVRASDESSMRASVEHNEQQLTASNALGSVEVRDDWSPGLKHEADGGV